MLLTHLLFHVLGELTGVEASFNDVADEIGLLFATAHFVD